MSYNNGLGRGNGMPRYPYYANINEQSPTRQGSGVNGGNTMRYVPPQARQPLPPAFSAAPAPEIRPESSLSNMTTATFATQPPMAHRFPAAGNYAYGPGQLTNNMAAFDPFANSGPAQQHPFSVYGNGNANSMMPPPPRPSFGGSNVYGLPTVQPPIGSRTVRFAPPTIASSYLNGSSPAHGMTATYGPADGNRFSYMHAPPANGMMGGNGYGGPAPTLSSSSSSANDSGILEDQFSRAAHLARKICQGKADDPRDPDYGNPGPSRKPAPIIATVPQQPRGRVNTTAGPSVARFEMSLTGNTAAFLSLNNVPVPDWFDRVKHGYTPSLEEAFESLPFIEAYRLAGPSTAGVVRISNIPYHTSRSEVIAFCGKNSQIVSQPIGSSFHAVHIIMERLQGKTMDAFVEFTLASEALYVVNQAMRRTQQGRQGKIGDRAVTVEMSSQEELMCALFPRAKRVTWDGGMPVIDTRIEVHYPPGRVDRPITDARGFFGFLQDEEIVMMTKHAETPQRSPFAQRCLIRCYESLISTLHKYPWYAHESVLVHERSLLFESVLCTIRALMALLRRPVNTRNMDQTQPTPPVLQELVVAALTCPGFSEKNKATIVHNMQQAGFGAMVTGRGMNFRLGGNSEYAAGFPFDALVKNPHVSDEVVDYYAQLFHTATEGGKILSLADQHAMRADGNKITSFGDVRVDYTGCKNLTDLGRAELRTIEGILGRILPRAGPPVHSSNGTSLASRSTSNQSYHS